MNEDGAAKDPDFSKFHPPYELRGSILSILRPKFTGTWIGNGGYNFDKANENISAGLVDMVAFATLYLSNPDLVARFKNNWGFNELRDFQLWFGAPGNP